jgi:rod shape-determining protein MreC
LAVVAGLALLKLPSQTMARFKMAIASLYVPLFGLSLSARGVVEKAGDAVVPRGELLRQNERLRLENEQLRIKSAQCDEIWRENARLRQLVGWRAQAAWKVKLARVIGRDPVNWWKTAQIDLGRRDGAKERLAVVSVDGLVGRISQVADSWSQVLLLGDPNLRVAAVIKETREAGVVLAGSSASSANNYVDLGYLASYSSVKPGQYVYSSGDGGVFPGGILIGRVVDTHSQYDGLAMEARVQVAAHLNELEEVWVLLSP